MNGRYGTSQLPLAGAILCCTSIPTEQRAFLAATGSQMGATIKLDLTSDVTHLVVGSIDSAKYRYVAKCREDVKVLLPGWLEALREVWIQGGEVDVAALETEYTLPTFYGLKICLTGFDNPDQRKYIQEMAVQNGAEYHGDLTKNVTHLIAAAPSGKKYEHAVNWRMKLVSWEWFEQSIERGMTLDEAFYLPTMPVEERGKGAWDRRQPSSPALGKRTRGPEEAIVAHPQRRKLRRSASSKVGSQSDAFWAGITAPGLERKPADDDDWTQESIHKPSLPGTNAPADHTAPAQDQTRPKDPAPQTRADAGIFEGRIVSTYGFDSEKTNVLHEHLANNGAHVIRSPSDLLQFSLADLNRGYLVIPPDSETDLTLLPERSEALTIVTNWWVERCLYAKCLVDPIEHVLCRPFHSLGIPGFDGLTINSTGFIGMEFLHVTRAVTLMGATYDEYLTSKVSVLLCSTRKPNLQKFKFATDKQIPAVHATWFWECLRTGVLQPLGDHMLNACQPQLQHLRKSQQPYNEVPTAPLSEEDSAKLRTKKAQAAKYISKPQPRNGAQRPRALDLTASTNPTPASTTASSTNPNTANQSPLDDDGPVGGGFDGPSSLPLQDIHPGVNSPRRPSVSSNNSNAVSAGSSAGSKSATNAPRQRVSPEKEPPPVTRIPPPAEPAQEEKDYSSIMSNILAQQKAAAEQNLNKDGDARKRKRQLGRASTRSNPSTADDPISRTGSALDPTKTADAERDPDDRPDAEEDSEKDKVLEYQPSQVLGWDAPGAQEARERIIRAMGGTVEDTGGVVEPIGIVKDTVRADSGTSRMARRKRG